LQVTSSVSKRGSAVILGLSGWATARASVDELAALRKSPTIPADTELSPGFLKNSDDQTVLALAVLSQAMTSLDRPTASYQDWGVVASSNLFGRAGTFQSLLSFRKDGAWGITPHMIPHHSLHAVSGTISQALRIHGPNFGVGGGPDGVAETFLAAATMISENNVPGLWAVMSGHYPEYLPTGCYQDAQTPITCMAAAFALQPVINAKFVSYLHISGGDVPSEGWPKFTLPDSLDMLDSKIPKGRWALPGRGWALMGDLMGDLDGEPRP
jgi:hypothetical protein